VYGSEETGIISFTAATFANPPLSVVLQAVPRTLLAAKLPGLYL
jgi:hypothetical protein